MHFLARVALVPCMATRAEKRRPLNRDPIVPEPMFSLDLCVGLGHGGDDPRDVCSRLYGFPRNWNLAESLGRGPTFVSRQTPVRIL